MTSVIPDTKRHTTSRANKQASAPRGPNIRFDTVAAGEHCMEEGCGLMIGRWLSRRLTCATSRLTDTNELHFGYLNDG